MAVVLMAKDHGFRNLLLVNRLRNRARRLAPSSARSSAGYSLLEVLFASFLLLVVAVSIIPMFTRALQSNLIGARASSQANFVSANLEALNEKLIDHEDYDLTGGDFVAISPQYWWLGASEGNDTLGDEQWKTTDADGGLILWQRSLEVRKYLVSDILPTVSIDGTDITGYGEHPRMFDRPLAWDEEQSKHIVEFRVVVEPYESSTNTAFGGTKKMTVGHYRTY